MYKLVGYARKSGSGKDRQTGQDFSWDNWHLYCISDDVANGLVGQMVTTVKAPAALDVTELKIGAVYDIRFNQWGRFASISEVSSK